MFRTGQNVPESGIYRVTHGEHRLPHDVTLLKHQQFPRCSKCDRLVVFEPVHLAPLMERRGQVIIYELPEMPEEALGSTAT